MKRLAGVATLALFKLSNDPNEAVKKQTLLSFLGVLVLSSLNLQCSGKPAQPNKQKEQQQQLHVYNWGAFIGSRTLPEFERRFSAKVVYENYSSNEELYAKLKAGTRNYDIVFPSTYMVERLITEGMIQPLDLNRISNLKNISKKFLDLPIDRGNHFSVPYLWGTTGLGVRTERVKGKSNDLAILFEPEHKGRITMLEGMRYSLGIALKYLGYSINSKDPQELDKAKQLLIKQKPLVKAYTDSYLDLLGNGEIWITYGYSGDLFQLSKKNPAIKYSVPEQGSIIGMDSICLTKNAQNTELAYDFINYLLEPQVAAEMTNELIYPTPNEAASLYIDKNILNDSSIYPPEELFKKCEFLQDVGEASQYYEAAWKEIREQ